MHLNYFIRSKLQKNLLADIFALRVYKLLLDLG